VQGFCHISATGSAEPERLKQCSAPLSSAAEGCLQEVGPALGELGEKGRWAGSASAFNRARLEANSGLATWLPSKLVQTLVVTLAKTLDLHQRTPVAMGWRRVYRV